MIVYEYEAKPILAAHDIAIPKQLAFCRLSERCPNNITYPAVAKVQILQGKRGKRGGVKIINSATELKYFCNDIFSQKFDNETPIGVLVEEAVAGEGKDLYIALTYDDQGLSLIINEQGGVEVEDSSRQSIKLKVDVINKNITDLEAAVNRLDLNQAQNQGLLSLVPKLLNCFLSQDCRLLEINPLRVTLCGQAIALDSKMILDNRALVRHEDRNLTTSAKKLSVREKAIEDINNNPDYKGSPCRYVELDGDVALLLSGGGASLIIFDTLVSGGVKPGNYSEYSGNPTREKVEALTKVILSKPDQKGLFIAGGIANFTLIDETMAGVAKVLSEVKPAYPIVIRRGGPNEEKARQIITEVAEAKNLDITWLSSKTSLTQACEFFIKKVSS